MVWALTLMVTQDYDVVLLFDRDIAPRCLLECAIDGAVSSFTEESPRGIRDFVAINRQEVFSRRHSAAPRVAIADARRKGGMGGHEKSTAEVTVIHSFRRSLYRETSHPRGRTNTMHNGDAAFVDELYDEAVEHYTKV